MTGMPDEIAKDVPWSSPLRAEDVPESGRHVELTASAAILKALTAFARVNSVTGLRAVFDVTRSGKTGLRVIGEVRAKVGQTCVVTLEPMETDIAEAVDIVYAAPKPELAVPSRAAPAASEPIDVGDEEDPPEPLIDGIADLGALATEFLLLGIDPYPRKPGASFEQPQDDTGLSGPFAALAKLKHGDGEEK
jgi:hypothetical protein